MRHILALLLIGLAVPAQSGDFRRLMTADEVVAALGGRELSSNGRTMVLAADNTMTARRGDTSIEGYWSIPDGRFCLSDASTREHPPAADCAQIEFDGVTVRLTGAGGRASLWTLH